MQKFIIILSFIPWLLYFLSICINAIKDLDENKLSSDWIKENIFKIFHFESLILFGIFVYFSTYYFKSSQIWLVDSLLFAAINLYLFINFYYDKNRYDTKLESKHIPLLLIIIIFIFIPIIFYLITKRYQITYYILFAYIFFNYIIVIISNLIYKGILLLIGHKNEKK